MKIGKEIKVGLTALVALIVAYVGFSYLQGAQILRKGTQYYAVYPSVDGLSTDNSVQLNGINVGKVNKVELSPSGDGKVIVGFYVDNSGVRVTDSTVAKITSLDLFGSKAVVLKKTGIGNLSKDGDTLRSDMEGDLKAEVDKRLRPLEQKTNDLIGSMDSLVTTIQVILDEETRDNLSRSFKSISNSLTVFERTAHQLEGIVDVESKRLDSIMYNVNSISSNLEKNNQQIDNALTNFSNISDSLARADLVGTFKRAGTAMERVASVMEKIDNGEGTVGMLVNNDSLYNNLNEASAELDKLLEDMRVNPKRYMHFSVFGRKEKSREKPEKKER